MCKIFKARFDNGQVHELVADTILDARCQAYECADLMKTKVSSVTRFTKETEFQFQDDLFLPNAVNFERSFNSVFGA